VVGGKKKRTKPPPTEERRGEERKENFHTKKTKWGPKDLEKHAEQTVGGGWTYPTMTRETLVGSKLIRTIDTWRDLKK